MGPFRLSSQISTDLEVVSVFLKSYVTAETNTNCVTDERCTRTAQIQLKVNIFLWRFARKGRREEENGRDGAFVSHFFSFPLSLALCHQSLTCHLRFFAKNEAPEDGVVVLLLRSRLRVKQHKVNQETRKWASYNDAVRVRCHSFHFELKTPVSIVFLAIK